MALAKYEVVSFFGIVPTPRVTEVLQVEYSNNFYYRKSTRNVNGLTTESNLQNP
jgi:hypothetical protein